MSRIATKPSAACTCSPSATSRQNRQSSGGDGNDALLGDSDGSRIQELAHLARRRATACSRSRTRAPAGRRARDRSCRPSTPSAGARARRRAHAAWRFAPSSPLRAPCPPRRSPCPGRGEYGKTWRRVSPARSTTPSVRAKAPSSSPGKPTMTSAVRLKSASGSSFCDVLRRRVPAPHRAEDAVVARLQRDVEMTRRDAVSRSAATSSWREVVHLDRREPQALDPRQRARLADESRRACSPPRDRGSSRG